MIPGLPTRILETASWNARLWKNGPQRNSVLTGIVQANIRLVVRRKLLYLDAGRSTMSQTSPLLLLKPRISVSHSTTTPPLCVTDEWRSAFRHRDAVGHFDEFEGAKDLERSPSALTL